MSAITTDNGSNVKLAASTLNIVRIPCFGHILYNAINNALDGEKSVGVAIAKGRKVCGAFSYSWKKKRDITQVQQDLKLPVRAIKVDCKTRWGTKLEMIQVLLEQEEALRIVLSDRSHAHLIPSAAQYRVSTIY
jgi:hypothetical protein